LKYHSIIQNLLAGTILGICKGITRSSITNIVKLFCDNFNKHEIPTLTLLDIAECKCELRFLASFPQYTFQPSLKWSIPNVKAMHVNCSLDKLKSPLLLGTWCWGVCLRGYLRERTACYCPTMRARSHPHAYMGFADRVCSGISSAA